MTTIATVSHSTKVLSKHQVEQFIEEGYYIVREAFAREDAEEALDRLWEEVKAEAGVYPNTPSTWSRRHVHIRKGFGDAPFRKIAHSPRLCDAFDDVKLVIGRRALASAERSGLVAHYVPGIRRKAMEGAARWLACGWHSVSPSRELTRSRVVAHSDLFRYRARPRGHGNQRRLS